MELKKLLTLFFVCICVKMQAQGVAIGASKPDTSAMLDIISSNKGLLVPRVALTDVTVAAPVSTPATSLLVYSTTAPTGGNGIGYYYWSGPNGSPANNWVALKGTASSGGDYDWLKAGGNIPNAAADSITDVYHPGGGVSVGTRQPTGNFVRFQVVNNDGSQKDDILHQTFVNDATGPAFTQYKARRDGSGNPVNVQLDDILGLYSWSGHVGGTRTVLSSIQANYRGNGTTSLSNLQFATSGAEKMRIDENGNVGIGISTPAAALDVNGTGRVRSMPVGAASDSVVTADVDGNLHKMPASAFGGAPADGYKPAALVIGLTADQNNVARGTAGTSYTLPGAVLVNTIPGATYNTSTNAATLPAGTYLVTFVYEGGIASSATAPPIINSFFYDFRTSYGIQRIHANSPSNAGGASNHGVTIQFTCVIASATSYPFALGWGQGGNMSGSYNISRGTQLSFIKLN